MGFSPLKVAKVPWRPEKVVNDTKKKIIPLTFWRMLDLISCPVLLSIS
jgi:hypothetical protein